MEQPILAAVALLCAVAALVWGRSALRFQQSWHRIQGEYGTASDQAVLAGAAFRKELHAALLYGPLPVPSLVVSIAGTPPSEALVSLRTIPSPLFLSSPRAFPPPAPLPPAPTHPC